MGSSSLWRLELVRAVNVAIGADRTLSEAYRTRFEGRPARVRAEDHVVTVEFPRFSAKRTRYPSFITLSGSRPWVIGATGQLSAITADLGGIELREVEVRGGASRIVLLLPRPAGHVPIRFAGGVADVTIRRPSGTPAQVRIGGGASTLRLDDQFFNAVGGTLNWKSSDYQRASDGFDIEVRRGASSLTVVTQDVVAPGRGRTGRGLATVLFTDIVGSTDRAREFGDVRWREVLDRHDRAARRLVEQEQGELIKTTGDGILAVFEAPGRAISCARALSRDLRELGLGIRAGIHTGEVEFRGDDVGGIAVHIAARIMDTARPDEILVSRTVRDLVAGSEVHLADRGFHGLRGVAEDWQLFAVI
jgi:class 3 adenylate cyclase